MGMDGVGEKNKITELTETEDYKMHREGMHHGDK